MISDSLPWLCPSLLGLAAGVHLHHCEGDESDRQGWFEERRGGGGRTCLHCTARMATDPEIAGV